MLGVWDGTAALGGADIPQATPNRRDHHEAVASGFGAEAN